MSASMWLCSSIILGQIVVAVWEILTKLRDTTLPKLTAWARLGVAVPYRNSEPSVDAAWLKFTKRRETILPKFTAWVCLDVAVV